jgi:hypothetical protein
VHFDIVASKGWKANTDFNQWAFKFEPADSTSLNRTDFQSSEIDVTETRARATTAVTVADSVSAGSSVTVGAVATFSVCTDESCQVLWDKALSFPIDVVASRDSPPGGSGPRPHR